MSIDPIHILIQLVIFLVVVAVLRFFVFQPMLRIRKLRAQATEEREAEAKEKTTKAQSMVDNYQQSMDQARDEARRHTQNMVTDGTKHRTKILDEARAQSNEFFVQRKQAIEGERLRVTKDIDSEVGRLADEFYEAVVE